MVGMGFLTGADGCGPQRPVPIPTVGIPMGYEQGASMDEGDNDDIACEGNRVIVVTVIVALLGMRAHVIRHKDKGEGM